MTSKETQIRNSLYYMLPFVVQNILPLIKVPIFTRILTPDDYGVLALAIIYAILGTGLANLGTTLAFERNYFKYRDDPQSVANLLFTSVSFVTANFILLAILTLLIGDQLSVLLFKTPDHGTFLFWTFVARYFYNLINQFYFLYYKNKEHAKSYVFYQILVSVLNFVISVILVAFMRIGVIGIVYAQLISGFIVFVMFCYSFIRKYRFAVRFDMLKESFKLSYPLTPRVFIGVLNTQFDKYMIGLMDTMGGVGVYHIAKQIAGLSNTFMTALQNVFNPQSYQRMFDLGDKGGESVGRYLTPFLYISILASLCVGIYSEELITVITPASYHGAIPIIAILSMHYGYLFFGKITGMQLIYSKKTHISSILAAVSIVLNIGFNIPLILSYGALGAAWATLFARLISGTLSLRIAQHYYRIEWEWKKVALIFLFLFGGTLLHIFLYFNDTLYAWRLILKLMITSGYLLLGIRFRLLTRENYNMIKTLVLRRDGSLS